MWSDGLFCWFLRWEFASIDGGWAISGISYGCFVIIQLRAAGRDILHCGDRIQHRTIAHRFTGWHCLVDENHANNTRDDGNTSNNAYPAFTRDSGWSFRAIARNHVLHCVGFIFCLSRKNCKMSKKAWPYIDSGTVLCLNLNRLYFTNNLICCGKILKFDQKWFYKRFSIRMNDQ